MYALLPYYRRPQARHIFLKPYGILGLPVEDTNSRPMLLHSMFSTYIDAAGRTFLESIVLKITSAKRLSCGSAIPTSPLYSEIYHRVLSPITFEPLYSLIC